MNDVDTEAWLQNELFTWQWWVLVGFLVIPWGIWFLLVDRKRILEILLFGMMTSVIVITLDVYGHHNGFWGYPIELFPADPGGISFDLGMIAVAFMLLYQYFVPWRTYLPALLAMAVGFAFIGEPFANRLQLYHLLDWKYRYSFVLYLTNGILLKLLIDWLVRLSRS
ncbi:CBO0543 family protein [Bacillus marinisedimentorum]|uniref:CBO0543 family protein n=1 Tax=Bacillus marinisedimentorum TaxID=1821260 RepID=UPI0008732B77|nr:CBO0543 family protein [Bacillus marinisedimentorum]